MNTATSTPRSLILASTMLFITACATPLSSTIDMADDVTLSDYETYAWISDEPYAGDDISQVALINPLNYRRIRAGVDAELERKGYVQVPIAEADLALGVTLGTHDRVRVQQYYDNFGYQYYGFSRFNRFSGFRPIGGGFGPLTGRTQVRTITEGTVALDVFDTHSREAIWHGHATRSLTGDAMGQRLMVEAVDALIGPIPERTAVAVNVDDSEVADEMAM